MHVVCFCLTMHWQRWIVCRQDLQHSVVLLTADSMTIRAVCSTELGAACDSLAEDVFESEFVVGSGKPMTCQFAGGLSL